MIGRHIRLPQTISTSSGTAYGIWHGGHYLSQPHFGAENYTNDLDALKRQRPNKGRLHAVHWRLHASGGWTFSSLRLVVKMVSQGQLFESLNPDPFTQENALLIYDSGTLTTSTTPAISESNTDSFLQDSLGQDYMPYGGPLLIGYEWATSSGSGSSSLTAILHVEDH